jgi:signal transduction histidine kinase
VNFLSLRARLTLLYGGLFLVAGIVSLIAIYLVVERRLDEELSGGDADSRMEILRQSAAESGYSLVTMPDGEQVPLEDVLAEARAEQEAIKNAALETIIVQGGIAVLAIGLVAAAFGWIVAGRGLQPLQAITTTAQRIAASRGVNRNLSERIGLTGRRDDIKRLADSFDAMLDTLDRAFDGQRRFVANASHELRTPLALERAIIELESTRPGVSPGTMHVWDQLLEVNDRHTRLIDGLLLLVDSENELTNAESVDLKEVVEHVVVSIRTNANAAQIQVETQLNPATVLGDPIMLEQLVRNLVENAIRHNQEDGWLRIETSVTENRSRLEVSNSGDGIPEFEIERIFEPFSRLENTRGMSNRGFGLGLSIVRAITTAHAGQVSARPNTDGGLVVTVDVPRICDMPGHE